MMPSQWTTPEEMERTKKRNKLILVIAFPVATIILSAAITVLLNQ